MTGSQKKKVTEPVDVQVKREVMAIVGNLSNDILYFTDEHVQAATMIQAAVRGFLARRIYE